MWRVIIRIGYYNDAQSGLRNRIAPVFQQMGLHNTDTGTWESEAVPPQDLANSLSAVLNELSGAAAGGAGTLEHLWIYVDRLAE